jgi:importin subunit beta-1
LGLIGDFGDTYKSAVRDDLLQDWVTKAIQEGRGRGSTKYSKSAAAYAQKVSQNDGGMYDCAYHQVLKEIS